jgi:hypothetical protein
MKVIDQIGHQGDTQWYSIDEIPLNSKKIEKQFIAASERSGSFHALFGNYDMYELEDGFAIDVKEECILNHSLKEHLKNTSMNNVVTLPKKDHRHSVIKKGKYYVGIQRKFDPMEGYAKRVVD